MRVGMILERDYPPDDRPTKEALSLIEAGFEVFLLCFTVTDRPREETYNNIKINRFKLSNVIQKKLSAAYLVIPIYRWLWKYQIDSFVKCNKIDIIHLHDLPMTDIVIDVARKYGCKVVCDQHEFWSEWIGNTVHYNTAIGKVVKFLSNWKKYELVYLTKADLVITVEEPLRQLYIEKRGIDPKNIINVPNTPLRNIFNAGHVSPEILSRYKDQFVIFYAGKIDILRGIDTIINALPQLAEVIPNIKFVIAGRMALNCNPLEMAKKHNVEHLVDFIDWVPIEELPSYITASAVCVFTPHTENKEINNTIATKIYQYAAMKKPILVSEARLMKDFVEENGIGFSINSGNSNEFRAKVEYIYINYPEYSKQVAENCSALIQKKPIFWENTVHHLINFYTANFLPIQKEG